jgi:putative tryptophan/tyrosine transport system substrate-binding protein
VKRVLLILLAVVLAMSLGLVGCNGVDNGEELLTIGIFQIQSHPALDAAREGFKDAFKAALEDEGLTEGDVVFIERNAAGDPATNAAIADYFVSLPVDLILAISTPCVQAAALAVEGTDIPVVFNSVTNPVVAGVVDSWDVPGGQITGVSDIAPVDPQLQLILDIFAANNITLEKLGVMYNPGEDNSVYQVDVQLPEAIDLLGLNITVVKSPATDTAGVLPAAEALATAPLGPVDAIWIPTDNTVVTAFEAVVGVCEDNDIPLFAADVATIERGAVGCWGLNYYDVGYTSGLMAGEILLEGADPAVMPVQTAPADELHLYPEAAVRMGVTIPEWLIDMADVVYVDP